MYLINYLTSDHYCTRLLGSIPTLIARRATHLTEPSEFAEIESRAARVAQPELAGQASELTEVDPRISQASQSLADGREGLLDVAVLGEGILEVEVVRQDPLGQGADDDL